MSQCRDIELKSYEMFFSIGPKTRETLASLFALAAKNDVPIAVLCGDSAIQVLQFRNLCRDSGGRADVFSSEAEAVRWFAAQNPGSTA